MYSLDQIMTNMAASPYFNLQPMTEAEYATIAAQENAKTQEALRALAANDPKGFARLQASGWQPTPFPTVTESSPQTASLLRSMNVKLYSGLPGGWSGNQLASAQSGMASEAERAGRGDSLFSKVVNYGLPIAGMLSGQPWLAAAGGFASGADEGLGSALTGAALAGGASYAAPYLKGMLPDVSGSMPSWLTDAASSAGDLFSGAPGATEGATTYPYADPGAVAGTALDAAGAGAGLADYSLASGAGGLGLTSGGGLGLTAGSLPFAGTGGVGLTAPAFGGGMMTAGGLGIPLAASALGIGGAGAASGASGLWDTIKSGVQTANTAGGLVPGGGVLGVGAGLLGSYLNANAAQDASQTAADAQIRAAQIAADAAKFRPVGVTTRFGSSNFGYDANGNLTSAGYNVSPEIKAQQDALMGVSNNMLTQYQGAQAATAPMGTAAQSMFGLGQGYLGTSPQAQAAQYMAEQQALLAPSRERELAATLERLQAQGRTGLAMGGTVSGMNAANPELEAYYNALRQQDLELAARATQGGMDYAKFGAGMVGAGGDMLSGMYRTQSAAYDPYNTAMGGATYLEGLGQQPMDIGINIGSKGTAANTNAGLFLSRGLSDAARTMLPANAYSPWGGLLTGAASALQNYGQPTKQQYRFDPFTGAPL